MSKACDLENGTVGRFNGMPHIAENIQVQTPSALRRQHRLAQVGIPLN